MIDGLEEQSGTGPADRPEMVDHAIRLLTGGECDENGTPRYLTGGDAMRELAKRHGMSERNARRFVDRARGLIAEEFAADLPSRASVLATYSLDVLRGAKEDHDWSGCNGAIRNLLTIYGIDAKTINVKGGGVDALLEAIKTPPGARDAEIAALEAKEREGANNGPDAG